MPVLMLFRVLHLTRFILRETTGMVISSVIPALHLFSNGFVDSSTFTICIWNYFIDTARYSMILSTREITIPLFLVYVLETLKTHDQSIEPKESGVNDWVLNLERSSTT